MSDDQKGSSGGSARRPKHGFDATQALLQTEILNKDKTRRISLLEAVFEGQVRRALAGDTRASELLISLAERAGIWRAERPSHWTLDVSKFTDDELETLEQLLKKGMVSDPKDDSDGSRILSTE